MHENKYERNRITGILGAFLLGMGLVTSSGAGAVVPAALGFAKEPMAPIGDPKIPLDRWDAEDPDWRYRPKTLEQALAFTIEHRLGERIVTDDVHWVPTVYWQWFVNSSMLQDRSFVDSIHNCRLRYTGSGDRWFPIRVGDKERSLSPGFIGNLWAYLDESGQNMIWDFELKCDTANGTETLRRRAIIDVSDDATQRDISSQDRIFMVPQNGVLPYRKGEPIRFVWDDLNWNRPEYKRYENHPTDPMALDRHLPCKLVIDYFPYAIVSPVLYAYNDPKKMAEAIREDPTMKPSDFIEAGKDVVIDITEPKGEVTIRVEKSAMVHLACKDSEPSKEWWFDFNQFPVGDIWVYDEQDPSEPYFGGEAVPKLLAEFTDAVDTDRYWAETPPVAGNCAAHYAAGRTADGTYWIADNLGLLHEKFCAMSVPGYEGFMWMGSFVPDAATAGYRWEGDEAAACVSPDTADAHYCAPAVIDALRAKYSYQGGEVGLYAPDTGQIFLYDVNQNPDAAKLAEFRSFLESHVAGGHTVTLWMR